MLCRSGHRAAMCSAAIDAALKILTYETKQPIGEENKSLFFSLKAESRYMFLEWFRWWL